MGPQASVDPRIERTRAVVMQATAELLASEGFEQITIEAIAERSGVARSTIYRNWPERADLLVESFDRVCAFSAIPDLGGIEPELRALAAELVAGLSGDGWGSIIPSLLSAAARDPELARAQRMFSERRRVLVGEVFARAAARGDLPSTVNVAELAESFAAGFFFRALFSRGPLDDRFVEAQIRRVIATAAVEAPATP